MNTSGKLFFFIFVVQNSGNITRNSANITGEKVMLLK